MSKKAVIYTCVISRDRGHEHSNGEQLKLLREYAAQEGIHIVQEFIETPLSKQVGSVFEEMVAFLQKQNAVGTILAEKTNCLGHDTKDWMAINDFIGELNIKIGAAPDNYASL